MSNIAAVLAQSEPDEIGWRAVLLISIGVSLATVVAAQFSARLYRRAMSGELGPNGWAGIRTNATTKSAETWAAAHQAGGPVSLRGLRTMVAAAIGSVVVAGLVAVAGDGSASTYRVWWTAILMIGVAVGVIALLYGTFLGHRAAKATVDV